MEIINQVNSENLYKTVYDLEGVKHPVENQEALDKAADYIGCQMKKSGLNVREQIFHIEGWDTPFRNVEGSIGPVEEKPAAVIVAHYDTVATTLGANDNAASVAVMLEIGRILAQKDNPPPVYFVAVSLEESSNPLIYSAEKECALRHGIMDKSYRYTSWAVASAMKAVKKIMLQEFEGGKNQGEAYQIALAEKKDIVPDHLKAYIEEIIPLYEPITVDSSIGLRSRIGSHRWVQEAIKTQKPIAFNITLDEPGIFYYGENSQGKLGGMGFEMFNYGYRLDSENQVGNFIMMLSTASSSKLAKVYSEHCQHPDIDLPYGWADTPMSYDEIVHNIAQALNSDHAPFWQAGIPAMFLFDSSEARDPYVHTMADTIDKIDFNRLQEVTQATLATLLDQRSYLL